MSEQVVFINRYGQRVTEKVCIGCWEKKSISEFSPHNKNNPNGYRQSRCRPCASLKRREYPYRYRHVKVGGKLERRARR